MGTSIFADYADASSLGILIGVGEIVSRYRDEPGRARLTWPAALYLAINAIASGGALALIREVGIVSTPNVGNPTARWGQVFSAGLGAMIVFRSSISTARREARDAPSGPAYVLQVILRAVDQAVARNRGLERDEVVSRIMKDDSFGKAYIILTAYCLGLLKNTPKEDQTELSKIVNDIKKSGMPERNKAMLLGLALLDVVGEKLLARSVQTCMTEIRVDETPQVET